MTDKELLRDVFHPKLLTLPKQKRKSIEEVAEINYHTTKLAHGKL